VRECSVNKLKKHLK